jgi:hypothetical protein
MPRKASRKPSRRRSKSKSRRAPSKKRGSSNRGLKLLKVIKSPKKDKKYRAVFLRNGREKSVDFGAKGYQNYGGVGKERHLDKSRKQRYINRHKSRENWSSPTSPGALSRWILWDKPTFREGVASYKRKFRL